MQGLVGYTGVFARFPVALHRFLGRALTLEQAQDRVRSQMGRRQESFLRLLREGVYGNPRSPYLPRLGARPV